MAVFIRGVRGEPVKRLQDKLGIECGRGIYDWRTERAVKARQRKHRLRPNGIADADTFAALGLRELILLRVGSKGEMVKRLQEALGMQPTGRFDRDTEAAVRAYQAEHGLRADGQAGPQTLGQLRLFGISSAAIAASLAATGVNIWASIEGAAEQAVTKVKSVLGLETRY